MKLYHFLAYFLLSLSFGLLLVSCEETLEKPNTGITTILPSSGAEGMEVQIEGSRFGHTLSNHVISFHGITAEIKEVTDHAITVVVPEGVTTGPVSLTLDDSTYLGPTFTVLEEQVDLSAGFAMDAGMVTIASAFVLQDEAQQDRMLLRLTPAKPDRVGMAYYGARIPVAEGFETTFDFRIHSLGRPKGQQGELGAEGFAFIIQNEGLDARGHSGGSMGYAGITHSVAIEFDIYQNQEGENPMQDPDGNHISVQTNTNAFDLYGPTGAEVYHSLGHTTSQTHPNLPELTGRETGKHTAKIRYIPGQLEVYVDDLENPALEVPLELSDYIGLKNGKAYVGFTAATGVNWGWAAYDLLNWSLKPNLTE